MHTKIALALVLAFAGFALGCGHRPEERRPAPREYRAEFRGDWNKLGERWVDGTHDRDVIPVGAREGAYRRIMIVVENSALEMYDVVVHFADGSAFSPRDAPRVRGQHALARHRPAGRAPQHPQRRVPLRQPARRRPRASGALGRSSAGRKPLTAVVRVSRPRACGNCRS